MGNHPSIDRGRQWLEQLLHHADLATSVRAEIRESLREHSCWLEIDHQTLNPDQIKGIIGDRGRTIDAMQYLANATLNIDVPEDEQGAYTIDINGYREQRHQVLEDLAEKAIAQLAANATEAEIPGLSSAERRQLHHWIENSGNAYSTFSRGQDPDRRLIVCPATASVPATEDVSTDQP
jgi:spoIIIJ-associated protein